NPILASMEFALPLFAVQRLANGRWLVRTQMGDPILPPVDVVVVGAQTDIRRDPESAAAEAASAQVISSMRDSAQVTSSGAINSMIAAMSTRPNRQNRSTCSRISVPIALTPPPPCEPVHIRCAPMRRTSRPRALPRASHSAVRALSVSAYNRGCMWHASAPHRPCIGHRTGYSLHAKISLHTAQACDCVSRFRGVFAHSYKRCRPRLFLRALRKNGEFNGAAPLTLPDTLDPLVVDCPARLAQERGCRLDRSLGAFFPHLFICCAIRSITGCHNTC